jgi:predicted alternative tryptophan synthase beta-subunit
MSPLISQSFGTRHISAWYTTEQNKKMLTSFNASTGSLGATLCDASRDAVKEEFTQVLKEQSILQVPLGRA